MMQILSLRNFQLRKSIPLFFKVYIITFSNSLLLLLANTIILDMLNCVRIIGYMCLLLTIGLHRDHKLYFFSRKNIRYIITRAFKRVKFGKFCLKLEKVGYFVTFFLINIGKCYVSREISSRQPRERAIVTASATLIFS